MPQCKKSPCFRSAVRLKTDVTTIRNCNLRQKTWQPKNNNKLTSTHLEKVQHDHPKQRKWEKRTPWRTCNKRLINHKTSRVLKSLTPVSMRHQRNSYHNSTDSPKWPKYQEYANMQKRLNTFEQLHPHSFALPTATAGFFFCGLKSLLICFFCGISHKSCEFTSDDWKELCVLHAKRSSKCGFVLLQFGEIFLQEIKKNVKKKKVSFRMLHEGLKTSNLEIDTEDNSLERDPAVLAVCELGYSKITVKEIAASIKHGNQQYLSSDNILRELKKSCCSLQNNDPNASDSTLQSFETIRMTKEKNNEHRQLFICKVCEQKNVQVVYLPCQHLVTCANCATIERRCIKCHNDIHRLVRIFF